MRRSDPRRCSLAGDLLGLTGRLTIVVEHGQEFYELHHPRSRSLDLAQK